jgi:uncharacterized protein YjbJ (UPF0337 family)
MSLKDRLSNIKVDQIKGIAQDALTKAKEMESKAEQSETGGKAKQGLSNLKDAAKTRFKK